MKITFKVDQRTSHQLEPVDDENVPKKARVARNVFSIRRENGVKLSLAERRPGDFERPMKAP